ncbi:MAG: DUF420 domain-containing protein [Candidatus Krumholzibacteriia bacterium]
MSLHDLPTVNAALNSTSAVLLVTAFVFIRRRRIVAHRKCMLAAFTTSCLFLVSYLTYHVQVGSTRFAAEGWIRPVYLTILFTHTVLAVAIVPLAILTLRRGLRADYPRHVRVARWTLPIWLYVSVTGVVIYWLLYHAYPSA